MKIKLTQQHIDRGVRGTACHCPYALAIRQAFPNNTGVFVRYKTTLIDSVIDGLALFATPPEIDMATTC